MKVSGLRHFKLGESVPARDHAVCVSLPTVEDLIGYEEKHPHTLEKIKAGYPRFVQHNLLGKLERCLRESKDDGSSKTFFFGRSRDAEFALESIGIKEASIQEVEGVTRLQIPQDLQTEAEWIRTFLQNTGTGISSRWAEDILYRMGWITSRENVSEISHAKDRIRSVIAEAHGPEISSEDVLLASSGANAFYNLFKEAWDDGQKRNKSIWIRLGWLYLDTIEVMERVTRTGGKVLTLDSMTQFENLERFFSDMGSEIAGVVTEFPTNPLLQSCDLEKVRSLCNENDSLLIIDPTMASPKNAKVSEYADVVVNSLTKYANWEGDVMMGSLVFPQKSHLGRSLIDKVAENLNVPHSRDLWRTAAQIPFYSNFIDRTNQSLIEVAEFLQSHPKIRKVYWAYQDSYAHNYRKIAGDSAPGCTLSFDINGDFKSFYDRLEMLKSPSFGTEFSICCPYVYLAHYGLTQSKEGLKLLADAGINPNLCRLSVGLEDADAIKETLNSALNKI